MAGPTPTPTASRYGLPGAFVLSQLQQFRQSRLKQRLAFNYPCDRKVLLNKIIGYTTQQLGTLSGIDTSWQGIIGSMATWNTEALADYSSIVTDGAGSVSYGDTFGSCWQTLNKTKGAGGWFDPNTTPVGAVTGFCLMTMLRAVQPMTFEIWRLSLQDGLGGQSWGASGGAANGADWTKLSTHSLEPGDIYIIPIPDATDPDASLNNSWFAGSGYSGCGVLNYVHFI